MLSRFLRTIFSRVHPLAFTWLAALVLPLANAQPHINQLDKIQAAYLFNFSKYTQWPVASFAQTGGAITLCLDDANLSGFLSELVEDRLVGDAKRVVKIVQLAQAKYCHISFFKHHLIGPKPQLASSLIVRHHSEINVPGHVLTFYVANGKVRFEVALEQLHQRGLSMSSEILKLARIK